MRPLLLHKSCQTKAIVDFSDLTIRMRVSHTCEIVTRAPAIYPSRGHMNCYLTCNLFILSYNVISFSIHAVWIDINPNYPDSGIRSNLKRNPESG